MYTESVCGSEFLNFLLLCAKGHTFQLLIYLLEWQVDDSVSFVTDSPIKLDRKPSCLVSIFVLTLLIFKEVSDLWPDTDVI